MTSCTWDLRALAATAVALASLGGVSAATAATAAHAGAATELTAASTLAFAGSVRSAALPERYEFAGSTAGGVTGAIVSRIVGLRWRAGWVSAVTVDWTVTAGARSFDAATSGTWNMRTGDLVLRGEVDEGVLNHTRVEVLGQITSPGDPAFAGSFRLLPATED